MAIIPFYITELFIKIKFLHQEWCDIPSQDIVWILQRSALELLWLPQCSRQCPGQCQQGWSPQCGRVFSLSCQSLHPNFLSSLLFLLWCEGEESLEWERQWVPWLQDCSTSQTPVGVGAPGAAWAGLDTNGSLQDAPLGTGNKDNKWQEKVSVGTWGS